MQYTSQLYEKNQADGIAEELESDDDGGDIESAIQKEIEGIRKPNKNPYFKNAQITTACCEPRICLNFIAQQADVYSDIFQGAKTC